MVVCVIHGIQLNVGEQIICQWNMFYQDDKKAFFHICLITTLCKRAEVPLFDIDEVLPMDPPIHPLLVREGSVSRVRGGGQEGLAVAGRTQVQTVRTPSQVNWLI